MHFHVGSFGCGVSLSVLLLYVGSVHRIETLRSSVLEVDSSIKDGLGSGHSESLANEASVASVEQEYSVEDHVENSTFGFEKILALGLPERSDRRDTLTLMSSYQNVKLEWMDAVKGEDVKKVAWPAHWNTANKTNSMGELGCWKSHVNAIKRVIDEGLSSALIIEDDADWDVGVRSELHEFANRTRELGNASRDSSKQIPDAASTESPYGDDWDILWIGACAWPPAPAQSFSFQGAGDRNYLVFWARGGMACTWGYAINNKSAKTLLAWLLDTNEPVDFHMGKYCERNNCVSVWPPLIGAHTAAGPQRKDSDIRNTPSEARERGETMFISNSAILDMQQKLGRTGYSSVKIIDPSSPS